MYIQYHGFSLEAASRAYAFHVIDSAQETREFTINVENSAFRILPFKFQDGPGICFGRLKQELDRETSEAPAKHHLRITPSDIQQYVEKTYPKHFKKWTARVKP